MRESGTHSGLVRARSMGAAVLALLSALTLVAVGSVGSAAVSLAATTALINGASGLPKPADKPGYIFGVADHLLAPNTACNAMTNPACNLVPVNGPETIFPFIGGLSGLTFDKSVAEGLRNLNLEYQAVRAADPNGEIVIFGYSQSGDIVTKQLRNIAKDPNRPPADQLEILIVGNTNRPNGGLLSRLTPLYIPFFNASFDGPTPTDTGYQGTDIAFYYDGIADFPTYPLNLLATVNALFGFLTIHPTYPAPNPALGEYTQTQFQEAMADPANRQTFGDTTFITLPIKNLPILHTPRALAAKTGTTYFVEPLLDLIEPTLTVLIELGYDRTIPYGRFTTAGLFPIINPIKLASDLAAAAAQGVQEAVQDLQTRPTPPAELVQADPLPFVNPNPFSAPYVDPAPSTSSSRLYDASNTARTSSEASTAGGIDGLAATAATSDDESGTTGDTAGTSVRGGLTTQSGQTDLRPQPSGSSNSRKARPNSISSFITRSTARTSSATDGPAGVSGASPSSPGPTAGAGGLSGTATGSTGGAGSPGIGQ
ncbi:PE-PPE domain-containing protein [Mycolicibacterium sediminis]|uniref:PE-PPE domain-containing protein n=1 Tax=Mycolicibacterium sediminis TaxID=1286180 RepID=A0A7I7QZ01_9MYCO|nr:PE-PPE domain-containing protein [Mycolicibacterium sediminis]BBY31495.1 hypothetical protein MSEDJ_55910 [Mycolicibacterium sediminis]